MAYIAQKDKAKLAPAIKAVCDRYGLKHTIRIRNHRTLVVTIWSGKLDLVGDYNRSLLPKYPDRFDKPATYFDVYPHNEGYPPYQAKIFSELVTAMKGTGWYDRSDIMTDYFDTAYYMDITVGTWEKPYKLLPMAQD